jgi:hypothetical protein
MKKLIEKEILFLQSDERIPFKKYKDVVQDDDIVVSGYDEGHVSENNSWDPFHFVSIYRMVLETDEEYEKRIKKHEEYLKDYKKRRYESYLKLKEEFENEDGDGNRG